ncbi:hypothetical protein D3C86_1128230 [compost metagenome]
MAPPFTLMISGFMPSSRITARDCDAKASFSSTRLISFRLRPASFSALGMANTGPIPIIRGGTPAVAKLTRRAIGVRLFSFRNFSLTIITKAAPSLVWEELPAVTEPPAANTGFNLARASTEVSARGPSSAATVNSRVFLVPLAASK